MVFGIIVIIYKSIISIQEQLIFLFIINKYFFIQDSMSIQRSIIMIWNNIRISNQNSHSLVYTLFDII